ncbi:hypothetical protein [Vibrio phage vB_VpaP_SJSY21]|nr:hypothetical protein [Vibrio phage vB_VpaP_SJSY21]
MGKSKLALLFALVVTGCDSVSEIGYKEQHNAAAAWYNKYQPIAETLNGEQELMGFVVKCGEKYHHTSYEIGGLSNTFYTTDTVKGCKKVAHLHTHPIVNRGYSVDFFSKVDLDTAQRFPIYVMAMNTCNMRYVDSTNYENRYGHLIGRISNCLEGKTYRSK